MPVDTFQLKNVAIKCLQGCWGPRHEKINGVSHSKITHCAVLISVLSNILGILGPSVLYESSQVVGYKASLQDE